MGTRIPLPVPDPPVPPGDPCVNCWGSGKPFGDVDTPSILTVTFSGVEKGLGWVPGDPEPIDGAFLVTQNIISPCRFDFDDGVTTVQVDFGIGNTEVLAGDVGAGIELFNGSGLPCVQLINNSLTGRYINGIAAILIPGT